MAPIALGLVGYRSSAKNFHLPFIRATGEYELVAVLQRAEAPPNLQSAPKGSHCLVDFPEIRHHRTAETFFADPEIDFVVVATHTDTHALFAKNALLAGKHVLVDKPFARSAEEVDGLIELANKKRLILTCYQNRRWDGDFMTVKHLIQAGALGDVKEAEIHYDFESPAWLSYMNAPKYTPGSGMAFGIGTHSLDHALDLFGRPAAITGFFRNQRGIESEIEDSFTIILQYKGTNKDMLVTVKTSVTTPMSRQLKYWIRGTEGAFIKHQQRSTCPQEEQIAAGILPEDPSFGLEPKEFEGTLTTYEQFDATVQKFDHNIKKFTGKYPSLRGEWKGLYQNVADAINGKAELIVKASQSRDVLRVIELARESHNLGKTVAWR